MTRAEAILNANLVESYLLYYFRQAYFTKDVEPYQVRIHVFSPKNTEKEIRSLAHKLGDLRVAQSEFEFVRNEKLDMLTFNIIWNIDN